MKSKYRFALMFMVSAFFMLLGCVDVSAATLVEEPVDDVYYTRRGGGQPYASAQYKTYTMDGKTVYCIEPGVNITVHDYNGQIGWTNSPYSDEINQKIQLYGYYGYDYPGHNNIRYRMAAQALIWEETGGQIIEFWTEASGWGDYININKERNEIKKLVAAHYNQPKFTETTKTGIINETITFTDSTGYLSDYVIHQSNGANVSISGNNLLVTPTKIGETNVILKRKMYTDNPTTIFVGTDLKSQKMGYFGVDDPLYVAVKVNALGGRVSLEKVDSKTLSYKPLGDASLTGAIYGIYDEYNYRVGEITTSGNNIVTSDYLPKLGIFYLLEEKSSIGYKLDSTKYYFEITEDNLNPKITVYEQVIEKEFELYKMFSDGGQSTILKAEPNITFEFYLESSMELYESATTDNNGRLLVKLPYGTYLVKQKNTTYNHEKLDDFKVVINENSDERITKIATNAEITAKLKLVKVDSESNKVLVKDGIKFKIKNLDTGEYVCQNITYPSQEKVCVFETKNGVFITPNVLTTGNYQIEELEEQTIEGYVWNKEPLKFSIDENNKYIYDEEFGVMLEVKFSNKQVKGEVEVNKTGEKFVAENGTFKYEEIKLEGVHYNLIANEDIYSQDGTLIYKDKEIVKSFITSNGYYKLTNLYLGKYCLVETETTGNHVLNEEPYCFEIKYKDQYTDIVNLVINLKNHLAKGDFELSKVDISTGDVVEGALIEIYTETDELIYSGRTDKDGKIHIKDLEVGKKYKFKEVEAPEGYVLNDEIHEFEILNNGEVVKDTLSNTMITGDFELTKIDISTGEVIEGALIEIFDENDNLVYSGYTDKDGKIYVAGLKYGKYKFKESLAPEGYILNDEIHEFEIRENGEVIKDTLSNEKMIIDVPNTLSNDYKILIPISLCGLGIILILLSKERRKK